MARIVPVNRIRLSSMTVAGGVASAISGTGAVSLGAVIVAASGTTPTGYSDTYAGFTYSTPSARPYLNLDSYAAAGASTAAALRLKAQVDDVVTVTTANSGSSYDTLVTALNADHYGYSCMDSVVMYRLTGNTDYIDQAITMMDKYVDSENVLIDSGNRPFIAGDSYLEVGPFLSQVAYTYDYGYSRMSGAQRTKWETFADTVLYNLWNYSIAEWGGVSYPWTGWSVDDPGNNYFHSFITATQSWAWAAQRTSWLTYLQENKYTLLVPYFYALTGGGSREGTGYGTAFRGLFSNYNVWKASTGEDLAAYSPHAKETIDYWVHATVPGGHYYASIGDQARDAQCKMFDYQRDMLLQLVAVYGDEPEGERGRWWLNMIEVSDGGGGWVAGQMRYNFNFRFDLLESPGTSTAPTALVYDTPGVGALFARSGWGTTDSWFATNCGYYDQSHAHMDQGSFTFWRNEWLSVTSNIDSNSGINQGVEVENVLRFMNGGSIVPQNNTICSKSISDVGGVLTVNETLTSAYSSNTSYVTAWTRQFTYTRSAHRLNVLDAYTTAGGATAVFQVHTRVLPVDQGGGVWLAGNLQITINSPASPTVNIVNMADAEFNSGYRLDISGGAGGYNIDLEAV